MERKSNLLDGVKGYVLALSVAVSVYLARRLPDSVSKLVYADLLLFAEPTQIVSKSILIHCDHLLHQVAKAPEIVCLNDMIISETPPDVIPNLRSL